MLSLRKIGSKEKKSRILFAENVFELMEEDVMVNSVKAALRSNRVRRDT